MEPASSTLTRPPLAAPTRNLAPDESARARAQKIIMARELHAQHARWARSRPWAADLPLTVYARRHTMPSQMGHAPAAQVGGRLLPTSFQTSSWQSGLKSQDGLVLAASQSAGSRAQC